MEIRARDFVIREHAHQRPRPEIVDPQHRRQKGDSGAAERKLMGERDVVAVHRRRHTHWLGATGADKRPDTIVIPSGLLNDALVLLQVARAAEQGMRPYVIGSSE